MKLHGKKGKLFIAGEVFLLDSGLLMGAECWVFDIKNLGTTYCVIHSKEKALQYFF